MDREQIFLQMEIRTQELISMVNQMGLDSINGRMAVFILENSEMVLNMEKVNGRSKQNRKFVIVMRAIILWTRKMAMVFSSGKAETFTRVTIKMMNEMVTVKCFGQMVQFTKDSGNKVFSMD